MSRSKQQQQRMRADAAHGRKRMLAAVAMLLWSMAAMADKVSVRVEGPNGRLARNVEQHLAPLSLQSLADARRQQAQIRRAALNGMAALGYYAAKIRVEYAPEGDDPEVILVIRPGEPVRWRHTAVSMTGAGAQDQLFADLLRQQTPKPGDILNHEHYDDLKRQLRVTALSNGYFDAAFSSQQLRIDRAGLVADINLVFDTGDRYRFGAVTFTPTRLGDEELDHLVPFQPGDAYEESLITRFNRQLLDTGYFRNVALNPDRAEARASATLNVPIEVELQDNENNRVSVGMGYGTDTGPRLRLGWLKPLINSRGHSLHAASTLSEPRKELTTEYKIPDGEPGVDFWMLQAGYLEERFGDNEYRLISYGVSRQQQVFGDWQRTYFTKFKHENGFVQDAVVESRPDDSFYITPGISFSRVKSDGTMRPKRGHRLGLELEFSDPAIGSDTEYVRLLGQVKYLESLSERQQVLLRAQAGMLWANEFNRVPVSARFFAGGDQSIRGYDYNSLSPVDAGGALIGGSRLALVGVDYLYRVLPDWQLAVFADHGGALDESNQPLYTGAGVGVRWLSPVGNISFDIAKALIEDGGYRLHISMGTFL